MCGSLKYSDTSFEIAIALLFNDDNLYAKSHIFCELRWHSLRIIHSQFSVFS